MFNAAPTLPLASVCIMSKSPAKTKAVMKLLDSLACPMIFLKTSSVAFTWEPLFPGPFGNKQPSLCILQNLARPNGSVRRLDSLSLPTREADDPTGCLNCSHTAVSNTNVVPPRDFQGVSPALEILQIDTKGFSTSKWSLIKVCTQETNLWLILIHGSLAE